MFFFPCVFSLLTNDFYFDLGPHYVLKAPKELQWPVMTITGPNNTSGIIWALGKFVIYKVDDNRKEIWKVSTTEKGTNHVGHVVWALVGEFFFFLCCFIHI